MASKLDMKPLRSSSILLGVCLLSACASQPQVYAYDPPGFWLGTWHGFTILFALVGHVFDESIRVYAFPNSGGWYDLGFFLGIGLWGCVFAA